MSLRVLDLFAGCGGLSLGLEQAGHTVVGACEKDKWAADTYQANHPGTLLIQEDINDIKSDFWSKNFAGKVDLVAGGPPCQGFSVSGKRQNGQILPQNQLVEKFLDVVETVEPKFALIENVGGFKTGRISKNRKVLDFVTDRFCELGYETCLMTLQAADYGVPSLRTRVFLVGSAIGFPITAIPEPTHSKDGKDGFLRHVSVENALSDLPPLNARERVDDGSKYSSRPKNKYQRMLRASSNGVFNHVAMNHSPRLVERFSNLPSGSSAYDLGKDGSATGESVTVYKTNNQRLSPDRVSPCVTANFQSTHVHYRDARTITAREAARLMSYPDTFVFHGKRTQMSGAFLKKYGREHENFLSQYNQIGNSVPPLLAHAIGEQLLKLSKLNGKADLCRQGELEL